MRGVIEDVLGRLVGRSVRVSCVLRGEMPTPSAPPASPAASQGSDTSGSAVGTNGARPPSPALTSGTNAVPDEPVETLPAPGPTPDDDARVLQAAKNLFDAEEIRTGDLPR